MSGNWYRPLSPYTSARLADATPARLHKGKSGEFLRRHERECSGYDRMEPAERCKLLGELLFRVADTRNLESAVIHIVSDGDKAPGPNDECLSELWAQNPSYVYAELRRLERQILSFTYCAGPTRIVHISKSSGRGTRPISIANWQDKVVQRGIIQIVQPLIDPHFSDLSYGFRPKRDRLEAIARVACLTEHNSLTTWITADLKDAFTNVPHRMLYEQLVKRLPSDVARLAMTAVNAQCDQGKGIPQGSPLSPLLLNVFLDGLLDTKWHSRRPEAPLFRYADDVLILCRDHEHADCCYSDLHRLIQTAGMRLKGARETDIVNLNEGQAAHWLGVKASLCDGKVVTGLSDRFWVELKEHLVQRMAEADGVIVARDCVRGALDQLGAAWPNVDGNEFFRRLASVARSLKIEEISDDRADLLEILNESAARFMAQRQVWSLLGQPEVLPAIGEGSAARHDRRPVVAGVVSTALPQPVLAVTAACQPNGIGWWAYAIRNGQQRPDIKYCVVEHANLPRLAFRGLSAGLEKAGAGSRVRILTDSRHLLEYLSREQDLTSALHQTSGRMSLANQELWADLPTLRARLSSSPGSNVAVSPAASPSVSSSPLGAPQTVDPTLSAPWEDGAEAG